MFVCWYDYSIRRLVVKFKFEYPIILNIFSSLSDSDERNFIPIVLYKDIFWHNKDNKIQTKKSLLIDETD